MLTDLFIYLTQGTVALAVFALAYRLFFNRLTYFQWNRVYLLGSAVLSILIPLLPMSVLFDSAEVTEAVFRLDWAPMSQSSGELLPTEATTPAVFSGSVIAVLLLIVYLFGCLYKSIGLYRNLSAIFNLIQTTKKVETGRYYSVYSQTTLPTFSFLNAIFLNSENHSLTEEEQAQVLEHEQLHVTQRHTLDLLLFEIVGIVFWFNPIVKYFNDSIRQVHEYFVDSAVTRANENTKTYGYLLLKLTTQQSPNSLVNSFSTKPIILRIQMLTQTPSKPMKKLTFLIIVPILALTTVLCSFLQPTQNRLTVQVRTGKPVKGTPIGRINWKGNTVYLTTNLNKILGVKPGDFYDKTEFNDRLFNHAGTDIASLYMDKGYLYFNMVVNENRVGKVVNLELTVFEGNQATIGKVTVKGNKKVSTDKILEAIAIRSGDLFNRSKLIKSQQVLAEMGYFNPKEIGINPIPNEQAKTVDLEYLLIEK